MRQGPVPRLQDAIVRPIRTPAQRDEPLPLPDSLSSMDFGSSDSSPSTASLEDMKEVLEVLTSNPQPRQKKSPKTLSAETERAEKRRKHREAMVLFRLKKKMNFNGMRKQEQTLQDILQVKLRQYRRRRENRQAGGTVADAMVNDDEDEINETLQHILDDFADVLTVKESLVRENRAMESVIDELRKFQKFIEDEIEREGDSGLMNRPIASDIDSTTLESPTTQENELSAKWMRLFPDDVPFRFDPETTADCARYFRSGLESVRNIEATFADPSTFNITETTCLGWRAQRSLEWLDGNRRLMRIRFTRLVPRNYISLDDLLRISWDIVSKPEINRRLYSKATRMEVTQHINENTFMCVRAAPHNSQLRYYVFNHRIEYRNERNQRCIMIFHNIVDREPTEITDIRPRTKDADSENLRQPITWLKDGVLRMVFTEVPERDALEVEYSGYMQCINEEHARYLMVEACTILLRWEHLTVPPRLIKM